MGGRVKYRFGINLFIPHWLTWMLFLVIKNFIQTRTPMLYVVDNTRAPMRYAICCGQHPMLWTNPDAIPNTMIH